MQNEDIIQDYNGWSSPDTFHFYNWLTERDERFITALDFSSIRDMREFFTKQSDIPNGIDVNYVNWFELYDTFHNQY